MNDDDLARKLAELSAIYGTTPSAATDDRRRNRLLRLVGMAAEILESLRDDPLDNAAFVTAEVLVRQLYFMAGAGK